MYILDLGESMGEKRHGRDTTDLDWALEYVWDKITTTVSVLAKDGFGLAGANVMAAAGRNGKENRVDEYHWAEDG